MAMAEELAGYSRLVSVYDRVIVATPRVQTFTRVDMADYVNFLPSIFTFLKHIGQPLQLPERIGRVDYEPEVLFRAVVGVQGD